MRAICIHRTFYISRARRPGSVSIPLLIVLCAPLADVSPPSPARGRQSQPRSGCCGRFAERWIRSPLYNGPLETERVPQIQPVKCYLFCVNLCSLASRERVMRNDARQAERAQKSPPCQRSGRQGAPLPGRQARSNKGAGSRQPASSNQADGRRNGRRTFFSVGMETRRSGSQAPLKLGRADCACMWSRGRARANWRFNLLA